MNKNKWRDSAAQFKVANSTRLRKIMYLLAVFMLSFCMIVFAAKIDGQGKLKGKNLYGRVKIVQSGADFKVQVVKSFPDLKVQVVERFPDKLGKWQFVENSPDFTIQYVDVFPDLKIQFVTAFPGRP
jgi:hypothetical protein